MAKTSVAKLWSKTQAAEKGYRLFGTTNDSGKQVEVYGKLGSKKEMPKYLLLVSADTGLTIKKEKYKNVGKENIKFTREFINFYKKERIQWINRTVSRLLKEKEKLCQK